MLLVNQEAWILEKLALLAVCGVNNPKVSPDFTHCFAVNL